MWEGGDFVSRSQFYYNVSMVERIITEIDNNLSFKEIVKHIEETGRIYHDPYRLAACCRSYIKNGKPSTFEDVHKLDDDSTTNQISWG